MDLIEKAFAKWSVDDRPTLHVGCGSDELDAFDARWQVRLPSDVRALYSRFNGFIRSSGYQDRNGFSIWPLENVVPHAEYGRIPPVSVDSRHLFVFADYLDSCWDYAFKADRVDQAPVYMVGTQNGVPRLVAPSIAGFLSLLLDDSSELYPSESKAPAGRKASTG